MSTLDTTISMIQLLSDSDLEAIQGIAKAFLAKTNETAVYKPQTEEQLLARVDVSIEHAKRGMHEDVEIVESELIREFGL